MQMPCVNVIDCEGVDSPVANLSAETPDQLLYFGRFYGTTCVGTCTSIISQEAADLCAATVSCEDIQLYYSIAASAACPDDDSITYSVDAGAFIALSQEAADALAQSFVDAAVLLMCDGSPAPDIFYSTAQSCEASCSNGTVTYTTLNQLFVALSQAEADALALAHACQVAELICENGTNINESRDESPSYPVSSAFNSAQTCSVACPDGGTFSYTVPRGTFRSGTQAQANAMAYSYACVQAVIQRFCLGSDIPDRMCVDSAETFPISVSGIVPDEETWTLVSGALPAGMTFSNGIVSGTPTTTGTYTFAIRLTSDDGHFAQRTYTLIVFGITNESPLDSLVVGLPYLVNFETSSGDPEMQQWVVLAGNLPPGLTLEENGVLHGTPTASGTFPITVRVLDSTTGFDPLSCMAEFEFPGCPVPEDYSYNCPLNAVPKSYAPANDFFVAFNNGLERAMISGAAGQVDIVDFTQAVPALDFTITLDSTGRVLAGIYDPANEIMVFCRWEDILSSQPTISFVNNSGTLLSEITLSGYTAGFQNNPYFTILTNGNGYVVLWLNSFAVGNKNTLMLIDTSTFAVVASRDIIGTQYSNDGGPAFSCEENEIVLTYRSGGTSFLHKINADDLTDVSVIDMGTDSTLFPAYDAATNQIICLRNPASTNWSVVYLDPVTGALEDSISMAYNGSLTPGEYNFKLLAYVIGKYDDGTVHYFDSLTHTQKCSVSFAGMINPYSFAVDSNGEVYVLDQGSSDVWQLVTT